MKVIWWNSCEGGNHLTVHACRRNFGLLTFSPKFIITWLQTVRICYFGPVRTVKMDQKSEVIVNFPNLELPPSHIFMDQNLYRRVAPPSILFLHSRMLNHCWSSSAVSMGYCEICEHIICWWKKYVGEDKFFMYVSEWKNVWPIYRKVSTSIFH